MPECMLTLPFVPHFCSVLPLVCLDGAKAPAAAVLAALLPAAPRTARRVPPTLFLPMAIDGDATKLVFATLTMAGVR